MKNLIVGSSIIRLSETKSTNEFARELLDEQENVFEGTVVFAENQLKGRGQLGKPWVSESGKSLCFSVILYPKFLQVVSNYMLSMAVSIGIMDYLESINIDNASIKWPNDIYIGNKKIAGILIENIIRKEAVHKSIVGVGINVNQSQFSEELPNPSSLAIELDTQLDIEKVLDGVLSYLDKRYIQLRNNEFERISSSYHNHLYLLNKDGLFKANNELFQATVMGVNKEGKLTLKRNEEVRSFGLNELELIDTI